MFLPLITFDAIIEFRQVRGEAGRRRGHGRGHGRAAASRRRGWRHTSTQLIAARAAAAACSLLPREGAAAGAGAEQRGVGGGTACRGRGVGGSDAGGGMELTIANPRGEAVAMRDSLDRHISDNHGPSWEPSIERLAKIAKVSNSPWQLAAVATLSREQSANLAVPPRLLTGAGPAEPPREPAGASPPRKAQLRPGPVPATTHRNAPGAAGT